MKKYYRMLSLSVIGMLGFITIYLACPQEASAGIVSLAPRPKGVNIQICFRGRTLSVLSGPVALAYVRAGAVIGSCNISGG